MKKVLFYSVSFLIFGCLAVGCNKNNNSQESKSTQTSNEKTSEQVKTPTSSNWDEVPANTNPNLKYFGFFHSDGFLSQGSQLEQINKLGMTNVLMLNSAWSAEVTNERLALVKSYGQVATIGVPGLFSGGHYGEVNSATLASNYREIIDDYTNSIKSYLEDGTVLAFYFDEPAWNGIGEEDFRAVTKYLREKWPSIRTMQALTTYDIGVGSYKNYPAINPSYNEFVTDVMYDNYGDWNDNVRKQYLDALKSKATNNQSIWGIPKGFSDNPENVSQIIQSLKGIYTEALNEPRYAGILSFSWCDGFEGDWPYGMRSFLEDSSDYFSRDVLEIYTDIGREVIGKDKIDWDNVPQVTLIPPQEVYEVGERVSLPAAGALDGKGNDMDITFKITSPSGKDIPVGDFVAEEAGTYIFSISVDGPNGKIEKTCDINVRVENEISRFESPAYKLDAGGSNDDIWCWPREITTDFAHTGKGSLKVTPHAKDGTWPCVLFQRNGYRLWNLSEHSGVSMWVYNPSDSPLENFGIIVLDENESKANEVIKTFTIEPKQWQELVIEKSYITRAQTTLDLTKLVIKFGNCASDYKNRTIFYIDDVMFIDGGTDEPEINEALIDFENGSDVQRVGGSSADVYCWPRAISTEMAHDGDASLKVTPHPTDGTWPCLQFYGASTNTLNISDYEKISLWVYNPSDSELDGFGLVITDKNGSKENEIIKTFKIASKQWQELTIDVDYIVSQKPNLDLNEVIVKLGNCAPDYKNRTPFFVDDFRLIMGEVDPNATPDDSLIGFETSRDLAKLGADASDVACWPRELSTEQHNTGDKSLKVTPHPTDGTWPRVMLGNYDLTKAKEVSIYAYFDSDEAISTLGLLIGNSQNTATLNPRQWTKISVNVPTLELESFENVAIGFCQMGATYENRSAFYIDSFNIEYSDEIQNGTPAPKYDATTLSEAKLYLKGHYIDVAKDGDYSKVKGVYYKGVQTDLNPSGNNSWCGVDTDRLKFQTLSAGNGVDEARIELEASKTGYIAIRQILLGWDRYEGVKVEFYLNDMGHKFAEETLTIDGSDWYKANGATYATAGDKIIIAIKYVTTGEAVANIVSKGIQVAECATEQEFALPEGSASFDAYYKK